MTPSPKNRRWLWYFLTLAVLSTVATTTLVVYNLRQQLDPRHVRDAIGLWQQSGPTAYVLVYTAKKNEQTGEMNDHYVVKVKGGEAYEVLVNGLPLEARQLPNYGMPQLLQYINRFMEIDAEPGRPKTYTRGVFDGRTGALAWYVRRVMGSRQRVEITVESMKAE